MSGEHSSNGSATILVIEDEAPIRRFLRAGLEGEGYLLVEAESAQEGIAQAATRAPALVLLDLGLPDLDGLEVVRRIREWSRMPIIVLSAREREGDKIRALDAGADDSVTKPFSMGELLARLRVALRRERDGAGDRAEHVASFGSLEIDFARRRVTVGGEPVQLTPIEYRLLTTLARHPGRVMTHEQLLREVWGPHSISQRHYLRVYMAQLRHKIEPAPAHPRFLLTEPGVGYRLRDLSA
jgi:two-component system KDP operon response regulator KdpE